MASPNSAIQRSSEIPVVDLQGMFARLAMDQGPLMIVANQGRYNLDTQQIGINGPIRVAGGDGYRIATRDVHVDLKERKLFDLLLAEATVKKGKKMNYLDLVQDNR